ncbi:hypothetical protein BT63DRAFT_309434 [Microthyrium microscopicum]|uniref:Uncharacterized protein n=1 Tax=Microthyrium microscopicum TaxID=703497 RepID=A0A6A6U772_9PEZI|nr:hypothetical protein BT63DRAFT_309434 [Microthyrium microscopicum]
MAIDVYDELPPSPTLTNPDMILPSRTRDSILFMSPAAIVANAQQQHYYSTQTLHQPSQSVLTLTDQAKYHGAPVSPAPTSPSILVRPSSPVALDESDTTPTRKLYATGALSSSPTLRMLGHDNNGSEWPLKVRRLSANSNTSSSVRSEELERWAANKASMAAADVDESAMALDEEDDQFLQTSQSHSDNKDGNKRDDIDDDFLSRRAEIILANAKKRLNMMEGNLKGARYSLSSGSISNRLSYASSRPRQSMAGKARTAPGHSRAASEASMPSPVPSLPAPLPPNNMPKRSSSALGSFAGPGGLSVLDRVVLNSLRGAKSHEAMRESQESMRENRLKNWIMDDRTPSPTEMVRSASNMEHRSSMISITQRTSPTPSEMRRPVSQASSIRAQMNELRDRISNIKERTKEGNKRASVLTLRTPSPYGNGEQYAGSFKSPTTSESTARDMTPEGSPGAPEQHFADAESRLDAAEYEESHYDDAEETLDDLEDELQNGPSNGLGISQYPRSYSNGVIEEEPEDFEGASETGQTEYFDADVVAERHEDRVDAFDYENFFLHSAMGSYTRDTRRGSYSSESSVETTRPAGSPLRSTQDTYSEDGFLEDENSSSEDEPFYSHERSQSRSTINTFQTALDGDESYQPALSELDEVDTDGEEAEAVLEDNAGLDIVTSSGLDIITGPKLSSINQHQQLQFMNPRYSLISPRSSVILPAPPTYLPSPPLSNAAAQLLSTKDRPSSALLSSFIGLDSLIASPETIQRDRAVVESVVTALQRCCLELQRAHNDKRDLLRTKLLDAQRILLEGLEEAEYSPIQ